MTYDENERRYAASRSIRELTDELGALLHLRHVQGVETTGSTARHVAVRDELGRRIDAGLGHPSTWDQKPPCP